MVMWGGGFQAVIIIDCSDAGMLYFASDSASRAGGALGLAGIRPTSAGQGLVDFRLQRHEIFQDSVNTLLKSVEDQHRAQQFT